MNAMESQKMRVKIFPLLKKWKEYSSTQNEEIREDVLQKLAAIRSDYTGSRLNNFDNIFADMCYKKGYTIV